MARSGPAGISTHALLDAEYKIIHRLRIANHLGTLVDYTSSMHSGVIEESLDQFTARGQFGIWRGDATQSLAPLMNTNDPIDGNRRLTFDVAVAGKGETIAAGSSEWMNILDGFIDNPKWAGPVMTVPFRDQGARLQKRWVNVPKIYGSDSAPEDMDDVVTEILTDVFGAGAVPLTVVGSLAFTLKAFEQQRMSVFQALRTIVDLNGADLRYKWNEAAAQFRLTAYMPDRAKTTPDHTLNADHYYDVTDIERATLDVRNHGGIKWSGGEILNVIDAASQGQYGEQPIFFDASQDPQFDEEKAETLITRVIADLATPPIHMVCPTGMNPLIQLNDLCRFEANDVHHAVDLDMAVMGIRHEWPAAPEPGSEGEPPFTTLAVKGKPSGGSRRWLTLEKRLNQTKSVVGWSGSSSFGSYASSQEPEVSISPFDENGQISATISGNTSTNSFRVIGITEETDEGVLQAALFASAPIDGQGMHHAALTALLGGPLDTATEGEEVSIWAAGYRYADGGGPPGPIKKVTYRRPLSFDANDIPDGAIVSEMLSEQGRSFSFTGTIATATLNKFGWSAGTLVLAGSPTPTTYSIAQQPSTMTASGTVFIYFDPNVSGTTFQTTIVEANTVGDRKLLIAIVMESTNNIKPSVLSMFGSFAVTDVNYQADSIDGNVIRGNVIEGFHMTSWTLVVGRTAQSANFVAGSAGWRLEDDTAEFNDVIVRGEIASAEFTANTAEFVNIMTVGTATIGDTLFAANLETTGSGGGSYTRIASLALGFYNATPIAKQTGVAVSSAGIHAALVNLGLIT